MVRAFKFSDQQPVLSEPKVGDAVVCLGGSGTGFLRRGHPYVISDVTPSGYVRVKGSDDYYHPHRFCKDNEAAPPPPTEGKIVSKTEDLAILAHPKPMRRHTKHVVPAECDYRIRLPGLGGPSPGLHLELRFDDGATQLIIFPLGRTLDALAQGSRMAASLKENPEPKELEMATLRFTNLVERYMRGEDGPIDSPDEEEVSTAMYALRAFINSQL